MQNSAAIVFDTVVAPNRCGEVIGTSYVLGEALGSGGMGVVYAATQRSLARDVAIKLPHPDLVDTRVIRDRFRNEAIAGARVNHPNVVRVLDFGEHAGSPFLVMERVVGPRLGQLLRARGPMPCDMAVRIVRQIVGGLEDVHANDIVHADLKTDNILVETGRDGALLPRLIDFGIARLRGGPTLYGPTSSISGTAEYLAPEVIGGDTPSFAADVHAIGVILYELVTGATPFSGGDSTRVMIRRLEEDAVPMMWRCPELEIPPELDALVIRALARSPARRHADAAELARELDAIVDLCTTSTTLSGGMTSSTASTMSALQTTATLSTDAVVTHQGDGTAVAKRRLAVLAAMTAGDIDAVAIGYLDLARALIDAHQLADAVTELEEAVELLSVAPHCGRLWPLLLTLAALHDGMGYRPRARRVAAAAFDQAVRDGSRVGRERAERLCTRLARCGSAARSPTW